MDPQFIRSWPRVYLKWPCHWRVVSMRRSPAACEKALSRTSSSRRWEQSTGGWWAEVNGCLQVWISCWEGEWRASDCVDYEPSHEHGAVKSLICLVVGLCRGHVCNMGDMWYSLTGWKKVAQWIWCSSNLDINEPRDSSWTPTLETGWAIKTQDVQLCSTCTGLTLWLRNN